MAATRTTIPGYLSRVRRLVYRHEGRRALCHAVALLGLLAVALPLLGHALGASRATAIAVLSSGGVVVLMVAIGAIVLGAIVPRRRYERDTDLARWIGSRHQPVASDLLSAVELREAPPRAFAPSPALVDALVVATEQRLERVEPQTLLPAEQLPRARRWALLVTAVNLILVAALPGFVGGGWKKLVLAPSTPFDGAELSTVPLVGDLNATLTFPAYSKRKQLELRSSSGDVRGLPGTMVNLRARVLVPAVSVDLVVEPAQGVATAAKTIAAKLDGEQVTAELMIDKSARYRFAVTSASGSRQIEATARAIDAEPDQAPAVQLMAPGDPLDVSNLRRVELAYVIEDDYGVASAELVWESGKDRGKKPITLDGTQRVQGKLMWDIAELQVPSGGDVRYWIEAKDNDTISGPNIGRSRQFRLHVVSPRERHEDTLGRQQEVAEKLLKNLAGRLTGPGDDLDKREELTHQLRDAIGELASIGTAYEKDPHASELLRKALAGIRDRIDKLVVVEQKLMPKGTGKSPPGRFGGVDPKLVTELEDDTIALADWLDRERMEGLLDLTDEIAAHQKRLADLLAEYGRTKDPRLLDEIDREKKALDRLYADLKQHQRGMPEDVLDQYMNRDAKDPGGSDCIAEATALAHTGKIAEAQKKLEQCMQQRDRMASSLEGSLAQFRGDKFTDEQKKLDEVMNELADVAKDQDDIAAEANRIFESYAEKADEVARDNRREASKKVGALVDKLRRRLDGINEAGLTPFAKEELDIVERRLGDVEHMVGDGDLAEALGMARQAKSSLDTIAGELEAALNDDPKSKWADATQDALDGLSRASPAAKELIEELQALSPRPDQIMSGDDQRALERLRRRQAMNKDRTKKLGDRTKQMGGELPGDASAELGKKLGAATEQMGLADDRMKGHDPSGAREAARAAADALAKARDRARSAARQAQQSSFNDEPIKIPGADEYRAPEQFREDLLEAMKKKGAAAPEGYGDLIKQYYQELIR